MRPKLSTRSRSVLRLVVVDSDRSMSFGCGEVPVNRLEVEFSGRRNGPAVIIHNGTHWWREHKGIISRPHNRPCYISNTPRFELSDDGAVYVFDVVKMIIDPFTGDLTLCES